MTVAEMHEAMKRLNEELSDTYAYVGIRFENRDYAIGEECEWSRDNPEREDEREFPDFGTEEYDELPMLNGTCVYGLEGYDYKSDSDALSKDASKYFIGDHAYIVAGNRQGNTDDYAPDAGEIIIEDAIVAHKFF